MSTFYPGKKLPSSRWCLSSYLCTPLSQQYGIDLAEPRELIAHGKTRQEVARHIRADDVIYQDLEDLKAACIEAGPDGKTSDFEVGVFCGQ